LVAIPYAVGGAETVDTVWREAVARATVPRAPGQHPIGYSGVFGDLDGHTWKVA
jgi:predicted lactoylglutathione lyase